MLKNKDVVPSKIVGIQFGILSPQEILNQSVAEIKTRDTYINNKPVIGGLFDPRMGVLDPGLICPTDGLNNIDTPGYFGHINLARPVFYIQYLSTIIKILKCTCYKCSKLLISKEKYNNILSDVDNFNRWNRVYKLANKVKRCGDDTEDGCGYKQPSKIKKEGLASLYAEWEEIKGLESVKNEKLVIKLTPEIVLKIFRRISDDDIKFMGFSPIFSRPEWMICQVLAVPPPAVRPSVKHDSQQRSEDDISHIIVNIIKANNTLQEKLSTDAPEKVLDDWHTVLQYYIATQIDNNIPGVASVAQRSGRPLKSIKERLNGKIGRVRGNLMGKRVDFSARSVITPDPNLSIRELGIPIKIAMNITKPVIVNDLNKKYLEFLVKQGPDKYPGAKILERKNGEHISLRYVDIDSIYLENEDIVHRHIIDGDAVLFNRQPTLHRMSMMCHIAKVLKKGNTFRMNVGDTKPYNADFDGDEMNLHMPQDIESEIELRSLAAVPYQIISPANNQSIVGIFQDSLLGSFQFTEENNKVSLKTAMNLLMKIKGIQTDIFKSDSISYKTILSQILPTISLKYKTKQFKDTEDPKTSNNILEIINGELKRGRLDKGTLGSLSKGLIQRIYNDFDPLHSSDFIDNLQNIITEYMKIKGYSVGISDLIADKQTNKIIVESITKKKKEVKQIIQQIQLNSFENKTGKSDNEEFETQVNAILNAAAAESGKLGRNSLKKNNRFVMMVNAGSKGSDINISQMISCLGQQNVDGKRIPYGFQGRTLPHFNKYDDSPNARGFVENSFIGGLSPTELFFHAQGGRVGLIDTAVKTSQTGYLQRRLVKCLEDGKVYYDMTVRNNKDKIIQFRYGNDSFDPIHVEVQKLPLIDHTNEDIYLYITIPTISSTIKSIFTQSIITKFNEELPDLKDRNKQEVTNCINNQKDIIIHVLNHSIDTKIYLPVSFSYMIQNIKHQNSIQSNSLVDITPMELYKMLDNQIKQFDKLTYAKPNRLFKCMYYYYLTPNNLLCNHRFNKMSVIHLLAQIELGYKKSLINPGEMVGMIAAQSIGEPTTQMTLNTFHFAGVASKSNVTKGVPRVEEILSISENPKKPSATIYLHEEDEIDRVKAQSIKTLMEYTKFGDLVESTLICFDPDNELNNNDVNIMQFLEFEALVDECEGVENNIDNSEHSLSNWVIQFKLNKELLFDKNITMDDISFAVSSIYGEEISCVFSDYNSNELIFRLRINKIIHLTKIKKSTTDALDQTDEIYYLKTFQTKIMNNVLLRGIKHIDNVLLRKCPGYLSYTNNKISKKDIWVLDTVGTNLMDILAIDFIDSTRTISNSIVEVYKVLGIEAARNVIYNEFIEVLADNDTYINEHHLTLLCDRMTYSYKMISVFRHGINNDDIGPLAKASFEETPEQFFKAAKHGELDNIKGISASVLCGQEGYFGTSYCDLYLDLEQFNKLSAKTIPSSNKDKNKKIQTLFKQTDNHDYCNSSTMNINVGTTNIQQEDLGEIDDDYDLNI
uniref:DNA-directed RNA polymerase subunit n=1 Tax=Megaviridae environmental sample TaxID=1737588 RepID=A0A5J6VN45_9VIRU|nr:MAG: RNA polymerase Rpb1, domain 1 [Megaviridae environmental sample]